MWNILKNECKRSLCNKWALIAMTVVAVFCAIQFMEAYNARMEYFDIVKELGQEKSTNICITSAYENWFLFGFNTYKYIFLFVMPILVVLPYGMSYYSDLKSGYIKQLVTRIPMKIYTRAKYIATFIAGGTVVTLPLFIQFMLTATIYPLHKPYRFSGSMSGQYCFAVDLFYEHPMIFTLCRLMLIFIVAGLLATVSLLVSKYIYNYFSVFITPFVISFILEFMVHITEINELSFTTNLQAECQTAESYSILLLEIFVLFVATYFGFVGSKKEVY